MCSECAMPVCTPFWSVRLSCVQRIQVTRWPCFSGLIRKRALTSIADSCQIESRKELIRRHGSVGGPQDVGIARPDAGHSALTSDRDAATLDEAANGTV